MNLRFFIVPTAFLTLTFAVARVDCAEQTKGSPTFDISATLASFLEVKTEGVDFGLSGVFDFAYSNCSFQATISGADPGPTPSFLRIRFVYNEREHPFIDWSTKVDPLPFTKSFTETPHDGRIRIRLEIREGVPPNTLAITLSRL
jgi:hypothetical protein